MTKESSPMIMTVAKARESSGNTSRLRWQELGRRQGVEEVVVTWA
jgi:hypothetical protein